MFPPFFRGGGACRSNASVDTLPYFHCATESKTTAVTHFHLEHIYFYSQMLFCCFFLIIVIFSVVSISNPCCVLLIDARPRNTTAVYKNSMLFYLFFSLVFALQDDAINGGAVTWSKKYHAVRLHDAANGEVLVPSQKQGISVVYEIWLGQQLVEFTPCDVPFDKNGVYFFTAPNFHRTGTFRLVFHVVPAQFYAAPPPVEPGSDAPPVEKKKGFNIKPLEFHVQVCVCVRVGTGVTG